MTHRVTIGVGLAVTTAATIYAWAATSLGRAGFVAVTQIAVYSIVGAYAWVCRRHQAASRVVLAAASLTALLTGVLLRAVSPPTGYVAIGVVLLILFAQTTVAVLAGYLGFACVEAHRLKRYNTDAAPGKLVVGGLLALGVAATAFWLLLRSAS